MASLKHIALLGVTFLVLSSFSLTVFAESLEDKLDDLQTKAADQKAKADAASSQVTTISEQLRQIQGTVDTAVAEYKAVKEKLDATEAKIDQNESVLEKTEADLAKKTKVLDKRVRDIYINGQISYVDVLFGAKDFSDLMTRMDLLKRIIKYDYDLITKVQQEKALVMEIKKQLEIDREANKALVDDAAAKAVTVKQRKANKQKLLDRAEYDRDTSERAYQEIVAASREVENLIRQSRYVGAGMVRSGNGRMIWPINGPITSEFGWRTHPIFGTARYHSGLDIAGDYGDPIVAADSGTVIYAGWISGYGNAVIINHGSGITSLYGHNQSLNVTEGQAVSQGQVIAYCGSTGNSTGPHCHFEVRENGEPVSPYSFL